MDKVALGQIFPCQISFHTHHIPFRAVKNRPISGLRAKWTQSHPTPRKKKLSVRMEKKYNLLFYCSCRSRYSDWLRTGRPRGRSWSPGGGKNILFYPSSRPSLGFTKSPVQWVPGALFPGLKRPGREADHSPPTSAEVKNMWIYTSIPSHAFMM
jgi:hypothetical protein